jgi:hypothetical protein
VASALAAQLEHPDRTFRDEVLDRLGKQKHGPAAMVEALLEADTPDRAWALARMQQGFAASYPKDLREKVVKQAFKYIEEGDRRADPLLHLARQADPKEQRDRLDARAVELRKKKQYDKALAYLRVLNRDPATGFPVRYEQAACALKCSTKDLAAEARAADHVLSQFGNLLHHHADELVPTVQKTKWLDAEDLYYLGFHFTEKEREEKDFGGKMLKLAIERSPRSQFAKDAKNKLKRAGLK